MATTTRMQPSEQTTQPHIFQSSPILMTLSGTSENEGEIVCSSSRLPSLSELIQGKDTTIDDHDSAIDDLQ